MEKQTHPVLVSFVNERNGNVYNGHTTVYIPGPYIGTPPSIEEVQEYIVPAIRDKKTGKNGIILNIINLGESHGKEN